MYIYAKILHRVNNCKCIILLLNFNSIFSLSTFNTAGQLLCHPLHVDIEEASAELHTFMEIISSLCHDITLLISPFTLSFYLWFILTVENTAHLLVAQIKLKPFFLLSLYSSWAHTK